MNYAPSASPALPHWVPSCFSAREAAPAPLQNAVGAVLLDALSPDISSAHQSHITETVYQISVQAAAPQESFSPMPTPNPGLPQFPLLHAFRDRYIVFFRALNLDL